MGFIFYFALFQSTFQSKLISAELLHHMYDKMFTLLYANQILTFDRQTQNNVRYFLNIIIEISY
jgi:hypothetical protein